MEASTVPSKANTADPAQSTEYFQKERFKEPFAPLAASILRSAHPV